ncbi:MAG TPA: universal stress protein, partial [Planctomycetota bacterium]|nr:universal stress protein [Planctomycetota bacterium]
MRPEAPESEIRAATAEEPCLIVPLDGTRAALAAIPVAKALAAIEGATVHIVHVGKRGLSPRDLLEKVGLAPEHATDSVLQARTGSPAEEICRIVRERKGSSVVMCARTGGPGEGLELGSVAKAVLGGAHAPVVFVPAKPRPEPFALRRIVFPHDGSPGTADAIGAATHLARRAGAELLVLHVATATSTGEEAGTFPPPFYVDQPQHEWPTWTREFLDRLCCGCEAP